MSSLIGITLFPLEKRENAGRFSIYMAIHKFPNLIILQQLINGNMEDFKIPIGTGSVRRWKVTTF
jgi:hypothetical protein